MFWHFSPILFVYFLESSWGRVTKPFAIRFQLLGATAPPCHQCHFPPPSPHFSFPHPQPPPQSISMASISLLFLFLARVQFVSGSVRLPGSCPGKLWGWAGSQRKPRRPSSGPGPRKSLCPLGRCLVSHQCQPECGWVSPCDMLYHGPVSVVIWQGSANCSWSPMPELQSGLGSGGPLL